jgi:exosortase
MRRIKNKRQVALEAMRASRAPRSEAASSPSRTRSKALPVSPVQAPWDVDAKWFWGSGALLAALTLWAYWPTLVWMESQWRNEPDYSHGYLVLPLALLLLYFRRDSFPALLPGIGWGGLVLLLFAIGMRIVGRIAYMDFLDGWTLVPWLAGFVWLLGGYRLLRWAWPAVLFLVLLTPLPYQAESLLSFKLQGVATLLSSMALQTMGFVAVPEGNTIWIGDYQMRVEEACSGLRILVGMMAMGFFFMVLSDRCWIDRLVILVCCIPIAIAVNVLRVIGTGLAYYWLDAAWAHQIHDLLGVGMILAGSAMFLAVKSYWEHLYRPLRVVLLQKELVFQHSS